MPTLLKNLLIALGLAVVLFVGYLAFFKGSDDTTVSLGTPDAARAELESQNLYSTLTELKSLDVKGEIFADQLFLSLTDIRTPLGDEPSGRANPFAPVE